MTATTTPPSAGVAVGPAAPRVAVPADSPFAATGRVRLLTGYDAGQPPPPRPAATPGHDLAAAPAAAVIAAARSRLSGWLASRPRERARRLRHLELLLEWLAGFPGERWEQRWLASGADTAPRGWAGRLAEGGHAYTPSDATGALTALLLLRVLRPSYSFLLCTKFTSLFTWFPRLHDPQDFERLRALPGYRGQVLRLQLDAEACLVRVMVRTGKSLLALSGDDLLGYADLVRASGRSRREHLAWELLVALGPLAEEPPTLRAVWTARGNSRQHTVQALVDRYGIPPSPVRDLLVDYLGEVRAALDYSTLEATAHTLARLFWWTVLQVNPDQHDLRLSPQVAAAWRERLAVTAAGRPRGDRHRVLFAIRAFYRDLQQWASEDPARWGIWVAPCPVRDSDVRAHAKTRRRVRARMQQRTRVLTPLLPTLVATATARRDWAARLLAAATAAGHGETIEVDGATYRREDPPASHPRNARCRLWLHGPDGRARDAASLEADCFWAWAVIETLRQTGCRIEELLELTQLSIRHYTPPSTGTLVPLLHIVASKLDTERLIPMSPELVGVLVAVQRRARGDQQQVPLSVRYDPHERVHGQPFPHLFARQVGARREVLSFNYVRTVLNATADAAGLVDNGQPIRFTPHDFRRLFTTELVGAGLPLHLAAALLGHLDLDTTSGYTAVFPEELIRQHQQFVERRRLLRDAAEYRDPTPQEWVEFERHFQLRRVALGDCVRPYGTLCVHEHACIRCPFLRLDPAQLPRLDDIQANTRTRLEEARQQRWLGEVAALEESLRHIAAKRSQLPTAAP